MNDELAAIFDRIANGQFTDADIATLRQFLESGDREVKAQLAKYNINIADGKDIHIGDIIYQSVNSETVKSELENLLSSRSDASSIRAFFKKHPKIIQRAFDCEIDSLILWDCHLNNHIFDICISKYYPTTHRHSWRVVQFGIVDGDILNSIEQCIININLLRNWASQNLKIARDSLPDFNSDFFGDIVLGRRINLSPEVFKKIQSTNDNLMGIRIRTYDWILQETANL
jgi:hypothetical protein